MKFNKLIIATLFPAIIAAACHTTDRGAAKTMNQRAALMPPSTPQASEDSSNKATTMLRQFYAAYMTAFNDTNMTNMENKLAALQRKYCTEKLLKKLPGLMKKMDADPFLQAQDSDSSLVKNLAVRTDPKRIGWYFVSYSAPVDEHFEIHLHIVRDSGNYKIADIR